MSGVTREEVQVIVDEAFASHELREQELVDKRLEQFRHEMVPDGKTRPHKDYHQTLIDAARAAENAEQERAKMYVAMQAKIIEKGIEGVFGTLKILVLLGIGALALKLGIKVPDWLRAFL